MCAASMATRPHAMNESCQQTMRGRSTMKGRDEYEYQGHEGTGPVHVAIEGMEAVE